jgi:hypothetical protein
MGGWWLTYSEKYLKVGDRYSKVSPKIGLKGLFVLLSEHLYYAIPKAET